jgi:hypothetical protein
MTALIIRGGTVVNHDHSRRTSWFPRRASSTGSNPSQAVHALRKSKSYFVPHVVSVPRCQT